MILFVAQKQVKGGREVQKEQVAIKSNNKLTVDKFFI